MIRYRIVMARRAERELARAHGWWQKNREAAPTLVLDELRQALTLLTTAPYVGATCAPGVRRLLLPDTRYHVFYSVEENERVIHIRALWHATRGQPPRLE